jgi:peptidoglycan/LPS O-acetylase OafA/YrhL
MTCLTVILAIETGWTLAVQLEALAASLMQWTSFGLIGFPDINGLALLSDRDFSILESLALAPLFVVVAAGNDLFGALSTPAARCLGLISYGTYVLHGIVLFLALGLASRFVVVGDLDPAVYWALMVPIAAVVVAVSAASYRWIEHPFLGAASPAPPGIPVEHA